MRVSVYVNGRWLSKIKSNWGNKTLHEYERERRAGPGVNLMNPLMSCII